MDCGKKTTKNFPALAYKILNDILILLLITFSLFLLAESALPGIISSHLSFLKMVLIIFIVLGLIIFLGRKNDFQFSRFDKKIHLRICFGGQACLLVSGIKKYF